MKKNFQYIFAIALILLEVFLILNSANIGNEISSFWGPIWPTLRPILIFLVIPLLIFVMLVKIVYAFCSRLGLGVKPELSIRPLDNVLQDPRFNGKAAAILLHKELSKFISSEKEGKLGETFKTDSRTTQTPTINFVGATFSFEWIKTKMRKFIGITDFEIIGLIDESKDKINITAWSSDYLTDFENTDHHWQTSSDDEDQDGSLKMLIVSLARQIAEEISPIAVANHYWNQSRNTEALNILSLQFKKKEFRTIKHHSKFAWIYYENHYYKEAIKEYERAQKLLDSKLLRFLRIRNPFFEEIPKGLALAYSALGKYDKSIEILENQLQIKETPRILIELGTTHILKENNQASYEKALSIYKRAEKGLIKNLHKALKKTLSLQSTNAFVAKLSNRLNDKSYQFSEYYEEFLASLHKIAELKGNENVSAILEDLADLYSYRARCLYIHQDLEKAKKYLEKAILVLEAHSYVDPNAFQYHLHAVSMKDLAHCYASVYNYKEAEWWYEESIREYGSEIQFWKKVLERDKTDAEGLIRLGWAYCGQYSSLLNLVNIKTKVLEEKDINHLDWIIDDLAKLREMLSEEKREEWTIDVGTTCNLKETSEYFAVLSDTISLFVKTVFDEGTEEQINSLLKFAETLKIEDESVRNLLDSMDFSEKGRKTVSENQWQSICKKLYSVVDHMIHSVESSEVFRIVTYSIKRDESGELTTEKYKELIGHEEFNLRAEANYLGACLLSISCDSSNKDDIREVVNFLQEAIEITAQPRGSKSSVYRDSAKLFDSYFDPIRGNEQFQQIVTYK